MNNYTKGLFLGIRGGIRDVYAFMLFSYRELGTSMLLCFFLIEKVRNKS